MKCIFCGQKLWEGINKPICSECKKKHKLQYDYNYTRECPDCHKDWTGSPLAHRCPNCAYEHKKALMRECSRKRQALKKQEELKNKEKIDDNNISTHCDASLDSVNDSIHN
jgi:hypothetical protein